jgi:hypothetical protein
MSTLSSRMSRAAFQMNLCKLFASFLLLATLAAQPSFSQTVSAGAVPPNIMAMLAGTYTVQLSASSTTSLWPPTETATFTIDSSGELSQFTLVRGGQALLGMFWQNPNAAPPFIYTSLPVTPSITPPATGSPGYAWEFPYYLSTQPWGPQLTLPPQTNDNWTDIPMIETLWDNYFLTVAIDPLNNGGSVTIYIWGGPWNVLLDASTGMPLDYVPALFFSFDPTTTPYYSGLSRQSAVLRPAAYGQQTESDTALGDPVDPSTGDYLIDQSWIKLYGPNPLDLRLFYKTGRMSEHLGNSYQATLAEDTSNTGSLSINWPGRAK